MPGKKCDVCKQSEIKCEPFEGNVSVLYFQWKDKQIEIEVKGKKKIVKKVTKEEMFTTKNGLMSVFKQKWLKFDSHVCNLRHQYQSIKIKNKIKRDLSENKVLVHMDFSENYNCKYE